ncbi:DUF234 domain-containing protein [Malaciobacter marinus]|uniref:ATPase, archaeal AAA+ ATPase superfamily n=1 Tax=Malaciobacter marinus TaxID=505249 RepID=A0AB36ZYE9_9BACT|nr:DUF234 domain-containing protein [Malaciobacter marinus]PPK62939.1 hypothetical protein B0F89_101138 [Malaciobacter marinus]
MLLNRNTQINELEKNYAVPSSKLQFIFGRKYIGKTALVTHFLKSKNSIFISLNDMSSNLFFSVIADEIINHFGIYNSNQKFTTFEDVLLLLSKQEIEEKLIIVFEDFQNILKLDKNALDALILYWKKKLSKKNIYFMVTSSIIFKEEYIQSLEKISSMLYLNSLKFNTINNIVKNLSKVDQLCLYTLLGTSPKYLKYYNKNMNLAENIYAIFLSSNSYLSNLGIDILKAEIQDIGTYCSILYAISLGKTKIGDIATFLNVKSTYLTRYIQKLLDMMIIIKQVPINSDEKSTKFGRYLIEDNALKFWFYYIYPNKAAIQKENLNLITKKIQDDFMGKTVQDSYKKYIKEYINNNKRETLGYEPSNIGSWWDNNGNVIDLIAYDKKTITFILILWQDEDMAKISYGKLKVISEKVETTLQKKYIIVSKNSFLNSNIGL